MRSCSGLERGKCATRYSIWSASTRRPGRARGFLVVAAPAGRHHVGPDVRTALAEGTDVIARQLARGKSLGAVHAEIGITAEQGLVVQRRHVVVARVAWVTGVTHGRDDGVDFEHRATPGARIGAAVQLIEKRAARV